VQMATSAHRSVGVSACVARITQQVRGRHASIQSPRGANRRSQSGAYRRASVERRQPRERRPRAGNGAWQSVASNARGGSFATRTGAASYAELGQGASSASGTRRRQRAEDATRTCGNELVSDSGRRQSKGERGATEAGNGGGGDVTGNVSGEGHRLESPCGRSQSLASRELELSGSRRRFTCDVARGSAIAGGETTGLRLEAILGDGARKLPAPACRSGQGKSAAGRERSGNRQLEHRACGGAQRISAVSAMSLSGRRWQHRRAVFHVAVRLCPVCTSGASDGSGDSSPSPPGGAGGREELASASFERRRFQPARRTCVKHAGSPSAWRHAVASNVHAGTRQSSTATRNEAEGAEGISRDPRGVLAGNASTAMCGRRDMRCEPISTRASCLAGSVGIDAVETPWRASTGACRVGFSRCRVQSGRGAFTEPLAAEAGDRRRRWCIQPIGYDVDAPRTRKSCVSRGFRASPETSTRGGERAKVATPARGQRR
jgi:hypothetical protein